MTLDRASSAALERLGGFLLAFQHVNAGTDHVPTYTVEAIGSGEAYLEVLRRYFADTNYVVRLGERVSLDELVQRATEWLARGGPRTWDAPPEQRLDADWLARELRGLLEPLAGAAPIVHEVGTEAPPGQRMNPTYEMAWADFLIDGGGALYLLHLGICD